MADTNVRKQKQCFLLLNMPWLSERNADTTYRNFFKVGGNPSTFVNQLSPKKAMRRLFKIRHDELSHLVPYIKLYKVFYNEDGTERLNVQFPFDAYMNEDAVDGIQSVALNESSVDLEKITESQTGRGAGAGLKSFEWEFLGTNIEETSNNIKANLELYFHSIQDLLKKRTIKDESDNGEKQEVRFVDLIAPITQKEKVDNCDIKTAAAVNEYRDDFYRIKAVMGWSRPEWRTPELTEEQKELEKAIIRTRYILTCNLTDHELNFNENGTINLNINFWSAVDSALVDARSNVLGMPHEVEYADDFVSNLEDVQKLDKRDRKEKCLNDLTDQFFSLEPKKTKLVTETTEKDSINVEQLDERINEIEARITEEREDSYERFLREILASDRMFVLKDVNTEAFGQKADFAWFNEYLSVEDEERMSAIRNELKEQKSKSLKQLQFADFSEYMQTSLEEVREGADAAENVQFTSDAVEKSKDLAFFYLGDLIDVAMNDFMQENEQSSKYVKFLLTDMNFYDPLKPEGERDPIKINLADIPVSYEFFYNWFLDNIVRPQKDLYHLKYFIEDVFSNFVDKLLGSECGGDLKQDVKVGLVNIAAPTRNNKDLLLSTEENDVSLFQKGGANLSLENMSFPNMAMTDENIKDSMEYVIVQAKAQQVPFLDPTRDNAEEKDFDRGVYWFNIGNDKGLVREMNFKRRDQPYVREARIENEGIDRFTRIREFYELTLRLHGNALFYPGDIIFINPSVIGFGNAQGDIGRVMGLVGYYQVITVENIIEMGNYETILNATWVSAGEGDKGVLEYHNKDNIQKPL